MEVAPATLEKNIRSWEKYFAGSYIVKMPVCDLTRFELKAFVTSVVRDNPMTRHYYNSEIKVVLNGLFDFAMDLDAAEYNIFRSVRLNSRIFKSPASKENLEEVFTLEEEFMIMDAAEDDAWEHMNAIPLGICLLFVTGIRIGELCALQYGDLQGSVLTIQRMQVVNKEIKDGKVHTSGYKIVERTKTSAGFRRIVLPDLALDYFDQIRQINFLNGFSYEPEDFIFRRTGKYVQMQHDDLANSRAFDARLRKYCKQLNLSYIRSPHDIRRTYISMLLENGMNVDTVRQLAGHENIEMTLAYCRNRLQPDQIKNEIEKIFEQKPNTM